ncbi:hypothetical protein GCM10022222_59880 [Amycolatopsis ultiminotia]|uniref:Transposase IS701-like DDE domain-containing protein n=1 Tax=Amycolatopsis ultiminotia TaxID=543629 RepID=A0ABP6XKW0_9PSEU
MVMLARAFEAKVPFAWITADAAYGQVKYLRLWLEAHDAAHYWPPRSTTLWSPPAVAKPEPTS